MTKNRELVFARPGSAELVDREVAVPGEKQLAIRTLVSAVSAGTELLFYRGEVPEGIKLDEALPGYEGPASYPLSYGYCNVGEVVGVGSGLRSSLVGQRVFTFRGHAESFVVERSEALPVPDGRSNERAVLLPMMETAVSLVMDGQAMIGERVAVVGQGTIGALTAALLSHTAVEELAVIDPLPNRRDAALPLCSKRPDRYETAPQAKFDLVYELSGNPAGLEAAVSLLGYAGRLVLGSWYGTKPTSVELGKLHRNQNTIHISQVSQIAPQHSGRFTKKRRLNVANTWLDKIPVEKLITHRVSFSEAPVAYEMLSERSQECGQVIFTY